MPFTLVTTIELRHAAPPVASQAGRWSSGRNWRKAAPTLLAVLCGWILSVLPVQALTVMGGIELGVTPFDAYVEKLQTHCSVEVLTEYDEDLQTHVKEAVVAGDCF